MKKFVARILLFAYALLASGAWAAPGTPDRYHKHLLDIKTPVVAPTPTPMRPANRRQESDGNLDPSYMRLAYDDPAQQWDIPTVPTKRTHSASSGPETCAEPSVMAGTMVAQVTNVVPLPVSVANGGTGLTTLTSHNLIIGNGTGNVTFLAPGCVNGKVVKVCGGAFVLGCGGGGNPSGSAKKIQTFGTATTFSNGCITLCGTTLAATGAGCNVGILINGKGTGQITMQGCKFAVSSVGAFAAGGSCTAGVQGVITAGACRVGLQVIGATNRDAIQTFNHAGTKKIFSVAAVACETNGVTIVPGAGVGSIPTIKPITCCVNLGLMLEGNGSGSILINQATRPILDFTACLTRKVRVCWQSCKFTICGQCVSSIGLHPNGGKCGVQIPRVASAVNGITITSTATGSAPSMSATGCDANLGLTIATKGAASITTTGGMIQTSVSKTAAYTATSGDQVILVNANAASFNVTMPATVVIGQQYQIIDTNASASTHTVTVVGNTGQTVVGASQSLTDGTDDGKSLIVTGIAAGASGTWAVSKTQ